jgi:hypothetical protein
MIRVIHFYFDSTKKILLRLTLVLCLINQNEILLRRGCFSLSIIQKIPHFKHARHFNSTQIKQENITLWQLEVELK